MSAKRSASRASDHGQPAQQKRAQWSNQSYTVSELFEQFNPPQIVKCNPQAILVKRDSPLPVNLGQPILLFDSRTVRKLLARNVVLDPLTGKFTENDDTVVIPRDYDGQPILLFDSRTVRKLLARNVVLDPLTGKFTENDDTVVIPRDYDGSFLRLRSRTSKDHTTHKTIESLASHGIKAFLNLTKLTGFRIITLPNGIIDYPRTDYVPGNVFAIDNIYTGNAKVKQDGKVILHKNSSSQQMKYLKCRDDKDTQIIIPVTQAGEFVEILQNDLNGNGRMSVKSEDLIDKQKFPIIVRYIRGRFKPRLTSFTGLFTLLDSYEETTIIACVLDRNGYTLIELPLNSPLTFHLALNFNELQSHAIVKNAMRLCNSSAQNFSRDLKFKFKFAQRFLQMGTRKIAMDDTDDLGDSPSAQNSAKVGVTTTYLYI